MSYFDIEGYEPQWLAGVAAISAVHGPRLAGLTGRRLRRAWLLWDLDADEWFADGPVLLDFDGDQVELNHQKLDELSITWNSFDPVRHATWTFGEWSSPGDHVFRLGWRRDALPELAALHGLPLAEVDILEYVGGDLADGMVAISFSFPGKRLTVSNGLDENALEFEPPGPDYLARWRSVHNRIG